ncbi:hypothetical protein PPERSA_03668 [Pseudocohnilembus persalinus]|uniref:Transmembrane protein n=1 Tax=Pseudocohnilembus persalinus TaxID=266149 RepID=A0A0V0QN50_PSEPJ|nr:hypothetical protein PPERSA_03668 [Pseudocohnilembus persalinus]|eukprot:KRX03707.1 hypothetical protein PPERSA_03668 [Pseudocohnilembus persalinus]
MMGIEQSSVNSSTDGATSMYHQKLDILKDFMENKKKMQKLIYVYALKFAEFVFILLALILQLVIVTGKLNFLENKLYLFESYSDFLQPLSTFVQIGQMTPNLVNSYPGDFSSDDLDRFYDFYTESYISQYASFKEDLDEFQIHDTSQQFLETEIEIKSPYDASQTTYMLMSAQYLITEHLKEVLQEDFITMSLDFISNKFLISNYYTVFNFYEQFREDQMKDLVDFNKNLNIIFIIYILVAFALNLSAFILSGINYNRYSADLINILNLMTGVPWQQAQIEKEYILQTIKQIEEYPEVLIEYIDINWSSNFFQDIVEKRREITAQVTEQQTQNKKKKISHIQINSNKINKTMFIVILTLGFILFLTPSLILLINNSIYFNKVDPIFEYLNDFLKTQVYIPAVLVFRFILVDQDTMKNESYLTQSEISDIYSKFEDYLGQLLDFRNQMDIPWSIDSMFSDNYEKLVEQISEENICKTEYSIINDDIELCEEIRFGVLKLGFKTALNELYKEKRTDVNINFSGGDNEDFEASIESYFMVQVLRELIHNIIQSSKEQVDKTQKLNSRVTYGFLIGTAFVYFFIFVKYFKSIEKDYRASKKVILLFPAITVLQEDTIVKKVKYYSDQYHIGN